MLELVLVLNAVWYAMGFNVFSIRSRIFAKLVVPKAHRDTPVSVSYTHLTLPTKA